MCMLYFLNSKQPNHKGPLARNICFIYCHLVCNCGQQELARALKFLEVGPSFTVGCFDVNWIRSQDELEWDLGTLLRQGENVDSELLLHLAVHYDQVLAGLKIWVSKVSSRNEVTNRELVIIKGEREFFLLR